MICPGGIFKPVFASLLKSSVCVTLLLSTTQLKTLPSEEQLLVDGTGPVVAALASRISRIC